MDAEKNTQKILNEVWCTRTAIDMLCDNPAGTIYRFNVYRRMYTPYEEEHKFMDETEFTDSHYEFGRIKDMAPLNKTDYLIEMRICDEDGEDFGRSEYYRLSEIRLSKFDCDNGEENCDEEDDFYES